MRRSPAPRLVGTVVLLILALVVSAVLAYQAWDAARSQRTIAERTLGDYAAFADWQLTQRAKDALKTNVVMSLATPAARVDAADLARTVVSPEQLKAMVLRMASWCGCLGGVQYYFRYDWRDGTLRTTETTHNDTELAWARDTIVAYTKSLPPMREFQTLAFGPTDVTTGPLTTRAAILSNASYVMLVSERNGKPVVLTFVVTRDVEKGLPVVLYGYVTDATPFIEPVFTEIRQQNSLLPPSLVKDLNPDSVLSIQVATIAGKEVYRSPGWFNVKYSVADTVDATFGSLVMRVSLREGIASRLIVGGMPRSRVPVLVGLFVLAAGLLTVALLNLRRQQELTRLRTEFVSGVSHELRTPLAQIRWFAELLHMGKLRSEEERRRSASIIDQEARRLTYLVENVLDFSRGEKGTNRISPAPVELEHEIDEIIELFTPLARARKMTVRGTLEVGVVVSVDRDALRQMLLNLLDNAVKYGPAGQVITIGTETTGDRVRIFVEDQGPGIPHEDRQRVWEPYVRLGRAAETATGGSGIGLAVVRELVSLHNGRTRAEGTPGGGARMVIELPMAGGAATAASGHEPGTRSDGAPPTAPSANLAAQ
jgi:signal transduction histidine kinase